MILDQCTYIIKEEYNNQSDQNLTVTSGVACTSWSYDQTYFKSTIVSEVRN